MRKGEKSDEVRRLQEQLLTMGYALPRFGADGSLGDETLFAIEQFKRDRGLGLLPDDLPDELPASTRDAIAAAVAAIARVPPPTNFKLATEGHTHAGRSVSRPWRKWTDLTGITLHQTATLIGEKVERWQSVHAHFGVSRAGMIVQMYELTEVVNHGNGLNATDVGIEIDGWFPGVEGKPNTLWQPKDGPPREPMTPTPEQIEGTRHLIEWICAITKANGGAVRYIHAHRQASKDRQSDPGSRIWADIGIWAQNRLDLKDGGMRDGQYVAGSSFVTGTGLVIPEAWDSRYDGNRY